MRVNASISVGTQAQNLQKTARNSLAILRRVGVPERRVLFHRPAHLVHVGATRKAAETLGTHMGTQAQPSFCGLCRILDRVDERLDVSCGHLMGKCTGIGWVSWHQPIACFLAQLRLQKHPSDVAVGGMGAALDARGPWRTPDVALCDV
jgi:hypothetical protein